MAIVLYNWDTIRTSLIYVSERFSLGLCYEDKKIWMDHNGLSCFSTNIFYKMLLSEKKKTIYPSSSLCSGVIFVSFGDTIYGLYYVSKAYLDMGLVQIIMFLRKLETKLSYIQVLAHCSVSKTCQHSPCLFWNLKLLYTLHYGRFITIQGQCVPI